MNKIFIIINGEQKGPYLISQLRAMWQNGTVTATTVFWRKGMADWQPLSTIATELEQPSPQPASVLPALVAAPVPAPESRANATQPNAPATTGAALFVLIVIIGGAVYLYNAANDSSTKATLPRILQNQYKVTMPNGDIVTMTESELEAYNKEQLKERQKVVDGLNEASRDLQKTLDKLKQPSPSR